MGCACSCAHRCLCGLLACAIGLGAGELTAALGPAGGVAGGGGGQPVHPAHAGVAQAVRRSTGSVPTTRPRWGRGSSRSWPSSPLSSAPARAVRLGEGLVGVALFGAIGVYCALTDHAARGSDVVPSIVAAWSPRSRWCAIPARPGRGGVGPKAAAGRRSPTAEPAVVATADPDVGRTGARSWSPAPGWPARPRSPGSAAGPGSITASTPTRSRAAVVLPPSRRRRRPCRRRPTWPRTRRRSSRRTRSSTGSTPPTRCRRSSPTPGSCGSSAWSSTRSSSRSRTCWPCR